MRCFALLLSLALTSIATADDVPSSPEPRVLLKNGVAYQFPVELPDADDIRRALPEFVFSPATTMTCELLSLEPQPPRHFPLVGRARLINAQYRVTATEGDQRQQTVIEYSHLVRN
jgi:hypothetical protein